LPAVFSLTRTREFLLGVNRVESTAPTPAEVLRRGESPIELSNRGTSYFRGVVGWVEFFTRPNVWASTCWVSRRRSTQPTSPASRARDRPSRRPRRDNSPGRRASPARRGRGGAQGAADRWVSWRTRPNLRTTAYHPWRALSSVNTCSNKRLSSSAWSWTRMRRNQSCNSSCCCRGRPGGAPLPGSMNENPSRSIAA
jgi:hypothetical protein